jgi:tricorn protease-like protein
MAFLCRSNLCVADLEGAGNSTDQVFFPENPSWSPDSQTIVFVMGADIYTFDRELQNRHRITNTVAVERNPTISPP